MVPARLLKFIGFFAFAIGFGTPAKSQDPLATQSIHALSPDELLKESAASPEKFRILDKRDTQSPDSKVPTYYWPVGYEIKIGFMSGDQSMRDLVKKSAAAWSEYANLKFTYVDDLNQSEVRIQIITQPGPSTTFLGTTCQTINKARFTMRLSLPPDQAEDKTRGTILHEFGHMLGFPSENQNPNSEGYIDWEKFYQYAQENWGLDRAELDVKYRPSPLASYLYARKPFDPDSVMMKFIPPIALAKGDRSTSQYPTALSSGDKQFVSQIYPKDSAAFAEFQAVLSKIGSSKAKEGLLSSFRSLKQVEKNKQDTALADSLTPPQVIAPSMTAATVDERVKDFQDIQHQIISNYLSALQSGEHIDPVQYGKLFVEAREAARLAQHDKAMYGLDDQYSPEIYKKIYDQSQSVGYLSNGTERLGSCFLIGTDLALTCNHCLKIHDAINDYFDAGTLYVRFGRGADPEGEPAYGVEQVVFQGQEGSVNGVAIHQVDFALLKLKPCEADGQLPSQRGIKPLPFSKDSKLPRDTALYVIGYPERGVKTVADNTRIFAGFSNSDETKTGFELEVYREKGRLLDEANRKNEKEPDPNKKLLATQAANGLGEQLLQGFKASFKHGGPPDFRWYLISQLGSLTTPHPAFALDSDTYHGNSGSPVFTRHSTEVAGVLFRGQDDRSVGLQVSWLQHEEAIPILVILQNWKDKQPAQPALYNVIF